MAPHVRCRLHSWLARGLAVCLVASALVGVGCGRDEGKIERLAASGREAAAAGNQHKAFVLLKNAVQLDPNRADLHYDLGLVYAALGRLRDASWELSETVRLDPKNIDAWVRLGAIDLALGRLAEARERAQAALALAPDTRADLLLARAQEGLGNPAEAEVAYRRAVEAQPDVPTHYRLLGEFYARGGDRPRAAEALVRYAELSHTAAAYGELARFLARDPERRAEAEAAYRRALELATGAGRPLAYAELARFLVSHDDMEAATGVLEAGIAESDPETALELTYLLARLHVRRDETEAALQTLESVLQEYPDRATPRAIVATAYARRGRLEDARRSIERARALDPSDLEIQLREAEILAGIAREGGDRAALERAHALAEDALARAPGDADVLRTSARIAILAGDGAAAETALRSVLERDDEDAELHYLLVQALLLQDRAAAARAEAARAVELQPSHRAARRQLAQLHLALGEYAYAAEQGRILLEADAQDVPSRVLVAQSLARLGRLDEALAVLEPVPASSRTAEMFFVEGSVHAARHEDAKARSAFLAALERRPHHARILRALAEVETRMGRGEEAEARIAQALAARPEDPALLRLAAERALARGEVEAAESSLRRSIELEPTGVEGYAALADLYLQSGKMEEALATVERGLGELPEAAHLHALRGSILQARRDLPGAAQAYERAIALDPSLAGVMNDLAFLLAESGGDLDRALALAQEAKARMPESAGAADTLGWVLYRRGASGAAVGYLREALAATEPDPPEHNLVRYHLALAYESDGQPARAMELLEAALAEEERRGEAAQDWAPAARDTLTRLKSGGRGRLRGRAAPQ